MKKLDHVTRNTANAGSCQQRRLNANGQPKKKAPRPITLASIKKKEDQNGKGSR